MIKIVHVKNVCCDNFSIVVDTYTEWVHVNYN